MRPQKVAAEARLGDELHAYRFSLGAQEVLVAVEHQVALFCSEVQKLRRLQAQLLAYFG